VPTLLSCLVIVKPSRQATRATRDFRCDKQRLYADTKRHYWSPHIHWTQKLSIHQQRTGVFTLFSAYVLLVMALAVFVWVFLQFRR